MVVRRLMIALGLGIATAPGLAQAECMGSCLDGMVAALASIAVYGVIGIVLLVMLIRAKLRRAGLWGLGIVAVLAPGVPLVSQAWQAWKLYRMERREVVGTVPDLTGKTLLYIAPDGDCLYSACEAVLAGRGRSGAYVLTHEALAGLDPSRPMALADLPLEQWARPNSPGYAASRRVLTPEERQQVAARIDYVVATGGTHYRAEPGPLDVALRQNPGLEGAGQGAMVTLMMAPLDPGTGAMSFADFKFDLLDLSLTDRALAIPLAPMNDSAAGNSTAGAEVAIRALCPEDAGIFDFDCRAFLER